MKLSINNDGNSNQVWKRGKFTAFVLIFQSLFVILFGILVEYGEDADANPDHGSSHSRRRRAVAENESDHMDAAAPQNSLGPLYPMFQDVHVMMFIGFGYLMTFLKRYGYSSVGFNFLISAFVIQWATLMAGFLHLHDDKILVTINQLLTADFACAAVLISFGAVLGKTSALQLLVMAFLEIIVFQVNEYIGLSHFKAIDVGGSMFVHVFGAYFGLAVARVLYTSHNIKEENEDKVGSVYHSDLFSMLGTLFLWMFWPSFNSAVAATPDAQHRAVINTYYSLCACTLVTFALSAALDEDDRFEMEHIQNATLAGGVAVGTFADLMVGPWAAMLTGMVAGAVCTLGLKYLTPMLTRIKVDDTCGVNNLHGMPGIIAGIGGIVAAYLADKETYGTNLYLVFPARAPENATEIQIDPDRYGMAETGDGWSAGRQAGMQAAALALTLGMAIIGGALTGFVLRLPIWNNPHGDELYEDKPSWHIPSEGYPHVYLAGKPVAESEEHNVELQKNTQTKI